MREHPRESPMNVERAFADISSITPSDSARANAIIRVRATVLHPRSRWRLWATSIAALLLFAAGLLLMFVFPRAASAQEALATTLRASAGYRGWVHISLNGRPFADWNTVSGTVITRVNGAGAVRYADTARGEEYLYYPEPHTVYIGTIEPARSREMRNASENAPLDFPGFLEAIRGALGSEGVKVAQVADRGMDRFDISAIKPPSIYWRTASWLNFGMPTAVWVDPKTKLLREMVVQAGTVAFTYGAPEFQSVYDAGAPRDAKVIDNRITKETAAAYDRVLARASTEFPDGVVAFLHYCGTPEDSADSSLRVFYRSGKRWAYRTYPVTVGSSAEGRVRWPIAVQDAKELMRELERTWPSDEYYGEGESGWRRQFEPTTGEVFHMEGNQISATNVVTERRPGPIALPPESVRGVLSISAPRMRELYPTAAFEALAEPTKNLQLITADDRQGLAAFRVRSARTITEEWFDPAHQDRPVRFVNTLYRDRLMEAVRLQTTLEFSSFEALPDGRTYPRSIKRQTMARNAQGVLTADVSPESLGPMRHEVSGGMEVRFFPGAALPALPRN